MTYAKSDDYQKEIAKKYKEKSQYFSKKNVSDIFTQVLDLVLKFETIKSDFFMNISNPTEKFSNFSDKLMSNFYDFKKVIKEQKLAKNNDIKHIENYLHQHINTLSQEKAVLVHTDLHMANILHSGNNLTAIIDFDSASFAPNFLSLRYLLAMINDPAQFVEGTSDFEKFKNKHFKFLLPLLKQKLTHILKTENLVLKLNLCSVIEGLMWVSQNWSKKWNEEMIKNLIKNETPNNLKDLEKSYYGKVLFDHSG
jgi:thiamine kinase-like enzyme